MITRVIVFIMAIQRLCYAYNRLRMPIRGMSMAADLRDQTMNTDILTRLDACPKAPGVYRMLGSDGQILYIGKSVNLYSRVRSYFKTKGGAESLGPANALTRRMAFMTRLVHNIEFEETPSATDALLLEASLVRLHQPPFNILLKDDKRYPYVCITFSDVFPRIFLARKKPDGTGARKQVGTMSGDHDVYVGPFVDGAKVRSLVQVVKDIFPMQQRPSPLYKDKPCLNYHIGRCPGVCQNLISPEEYRHTIRLAQKVFEGDGSEVVESLETKMLALAKDERFEEAAHLRDTSIKLSEAIKGSSLHFSATGAGGSSSKFSADVTSCVDVVGIAAVDLVSEAETETEGDSDASKNMNEAGDSQEGEKAYVIHIIKVRNGRISSRVGFTHSATCGSDFAAGALLQRVLEDYYTSCSSAPPRTTILPDSPPIPEPEMLKSIIEERLNIDFPQEGEVAEALANAVDDSDGSVRQRKVSVTHDVVVTSARGAGESHLCTYVEQLARREAGVLLSERVRTGEGLLQVAEMLGMGVTPSIIEGYDISHLSGTNSVASKVVFVDGVPDKSKYRRYKLKDGEAGSPDDYASIREVLTRRFLSGRGNKGNKDPLPDLVLIDGGRGQLSSAVSVLEKVSPLDGGGDGGGSKGGSDVGVVVNGGPVLISLAKRNEEVFAIVDGEAVRVNDEYDEASPVMRLLRHVRDEAHNYAVTYQRSLRKTF